MAAFSELYEDLTLYITPEKFYIEPLSNNQELLVIDRVSQEIVIQTNHGQIPLSSSSQIICGIVGVIRLIAGPYLIVITKKQKVGTINGQTIWSIKSNEMIPYARTQLHLTESQIRLNRVYEAMLESALNTPYLYFSYSYDVTHTLQRLHNTTPEFLQMPLFERADLRFVWNGHLLREFSLQPELHKFCLPLLHGFISINQCSLNSQTFQWILISRRCCFRAGTRLFKRGADSQGNVANFVETEQIIEYNGDRSSFVQTRGSIPLIWYQLPNLKYKPKPWVSQYGNLDDAFASHFDTQIFNYGRQVLVNLIDQSGAEFILEQSFRNMVNKLGNPNIRYEGFDFHAECRRMRWDRLDILIDRLAHEQDEFGAFILARDGTLVLQQEGVFRTNCIDCLDRTNVVQSMLARRSLDLVLKKFAILHINQRIQDQLGFEALFKEVWADNADIISLQYSGTGALKTDFTRTGKRTKMGMMRDLINSITRYYKNNFADGFRQDSIDLFLGNYQINENEGASRFSPLEAKKGWKYMTFPLVLLSAIAMFCGNLITPTEYTTETLLYLLFWGSMVIVTFSTIIRYGTEFVDYPKLSDLRIRDDAE